MCIRDSDLPPHINMQLSAERIEITHRETDDRVHRPISSFDETCCQSLNGVRPSLVPIFGVAQVGLPLILAQASHEHTRYGCSNGCRLFRHKNSRHGGNDAVFPPLEQREHITGLNFVERLSQDSTVTGDDGVGPNDEPCVHMITSRSCFCQCVPCCTVLRCNIQHDFVHVSLHDRERYTPVGEHVSPAWRTRGQVKLHTSVEKKRKSRASPTVPRFMLSVKPSRSSMKPS